MKIPEIQSSHRLRSDQSQHFATNNAMTKTQFVQRSVVGPAYDPADDKVLRHWIVLRARKNYRDAILAAVRCWTTWLDVISQEEPPSTAELDLVDALQSYADVLVTIMTHISIGTGMNKAKPGQEDQETGATQKDVSAVDRFAKLVKSRAHSWNLPQNHGTRVLVASPAALFVRALAVRAQAREHDRWRAMGMFET